MMIAATQNGIYKTTDAAITWELIQNGHFKDIAFKPGNSDVVYATGFSLYGGASIFKSTDAGDSFYFLDNTGIQTSEVSRIALGVSIANPDIIYAFCARTYPNANFYGMFKSMDSGETWEETISGTDINLMGRSAYGVDTEGYGWYTCSIAVSPLDENEVYTGGINIWKSSDGGYNWEIRHMK